MPLVPAGVGALVGLGARVEIEAGLGMSLHYRDRDYVSAGASISADRQDLLASAELVLRLGSPPLEEIDWLPDGCLHVSFLDPSVSPEVVERLASRNVSALSMQMIPRSTRAQKMDALSSQASLAGYVAVVLAADLSDRVFPMMMTPAGTISPAVVFVIGAGVAGLQSIATARRLGARVLAHDPRPGVEEEIRSLGARPVSIELGEVGQTGEGYARELTRDQISRQREKLAEICAGADVVITTAQVFGGPAPRLLTREMLAGMKTGSVVVDLAVSGGGNVEGVVADEVVEFEGVRIVGFSSLAGRVPLPASHMYSGNLVHLVSEFWDPQGKRLALDPEDEILRACLVTHRGRVLDRGPR